MTKQRLLILEDEFLIALDMADEFSARGWEIVGPAGTVADAEKLINEAMPDMAVLDVNIGEDTSYIFAKNLVQNDIHVVFLSGDTAEARPDALKDCPVLSKPIAFDDLADALEDRVK